MRRRQRTATRVGLFGLAVCLSLVIAACGSSSSSSSTSASSNSAASGSANNISSSSSGSCVATAEAATQKAEASPAMPLPAGKLAAAKLAGKKLYLVLSVPTELSQGFSVSFKQAAQALGMSAVVVNGQGSVSAANQGVSQAIASGAAGILLWGVPPSEVSGPVAQAEKAGITVVDSFNGGPSQPLTNGIFAHATYNVALSGQQKADWLLANSKCKLNVGILTNTVAPVISQTANSEIAEIKRLCSSCKEQTAELNLATLATSAGPLVENMLTRNPDINYVDTSFDTVVTFVAPAIASSHPNVKIVAHDGVPANLDSLRKGGQQVMDDAFAPAGFIGFDFVNQLARGILKLKPDPMVIPQRVIDKSNIGSSNAALFPDFTDYAAKFEKAWGVK